MAELDNTFLEIAVALQGGALSFFVGTGFSKYLTNNNAPSWLELIKESAKRLDDNKIYKQLFDKQGKCKFDRKRQI